MKLSPFILIVSIAIFSQCNYLPKIEDESVDNFNSKTEDIIGMLDARGSDNLLAFYPSDLIDSVSTKKKPTEQKSVHSGKVLKKERKDKLSKTKQDQIVGKNKNEELLDSISLISDTVHISSVYSMGRMIIYSFLENNYYRKGIIEYLSPHTRIELDTSRTAHEVSLLFELENEMDNHSKSTKKPLKIPSSEDSLDSTKTSQPDSTVSTIS